MLLVIGLTGLAGSGKSEVSAHLMARHGFQKFVFSDVIREEANKRSLLGNKTYEDQKTVLSELGETLRRESGRWDILAIRLAEKISLGGYERVVVDGFRSAEEVELFRKKFDRFFLILIEADEKIRFQRRKIEDPFATIAGIRSRDKRDIKELGLGKVIKMADFRVKNNKDKENLKKEIDTILAKVTD